MKKVIVCINHRVNPGQPSCAARGSRQFADLIESGIRDGKIDIELERFMCLGRCERGPNIKLVPGGHFITGVHAGNIPKIMDEIRAFAVGQSKGAPVPE